MACAGSAKARAHAFIGTTTCRGRGSSKTGEFFALALRWRGSGVGQFMSPGRVGVDLIKLCQVKLTPCPPSPVKLQHSTNRKKCHPSPPGDISCPTGGGGGRLPRLEVHRMAGHICAMRLKTLSKNVPFLAFAIGFFLQGCASPQRLNTIGAFASGDRITFTNAAPVPALNLKLEGQVLAGGEWHTIAKSPIPEIPGTESIASDKFPGDVTAFDLKVSSPGGNARLRWNGGISPGTKTVRIWPGFPHGNPVVIDVP